MRSIGRLIASLVVVGSTFVSVAEAAAYRFTLNVTTVNFQSVVGTPIAGPEPCVMVGINQFFGCVLPGASFFGSFNIPDVALLTDGIKDNTGITNFVLDVGHVHYPNVPGFRGSNFQFSSSVGVDVIGGQVAYLIGGVFSAGDQPYVDFLGDFAGPNQFGKFNALDVFGEVLGGTVTVTRVPEPAPLLLVGFGAALGLASRRKRVSSRRPRCL